MKKHIEVHEDAPKEACLEFQDLLGIGMSLVVLVIGLSFGADITSDIGDDMTADSTEKNITVNGLTALNKISVKLPTIIGVMIAAVIIGVLVRHLYVQYSG
jgi:hypothetical protein